MYIKLTVVAMGDVAIFWVASKTDVEQFEYVVLFQPWQRVF